MPIEKQYRLAEAGDLLGLKESTLRKWALLRKVRITKIGGATRIPASELARLISQGERPAREEQR